MPAIFGMPGGEEWIVIIGILVLLFVPGAGLLSLGYLLGRSGAARITEKALEASEADARAAAASQCPGGSGENATPTDESETKGPGGIDE